MPDSAPGSEEAPASQPTDLPLIREFDDRSSLWLLEDPQLLRGLLQILDPHLVERLDFDHARRINRSYIPADLQKEESDLVYAVPFRRRGREVWVYVLLEHQSKPDPLMSLRLYDYMGELWKAQRREWDDQNAPAARRRLRPIIPVVYYTGERRWQAPLSLKQLMDVPAELERFVPDWETLYLNLRETPPETLTQFTSAIGWALRVLQAEAAPLAELERVLQEAMAGLEGLTAEQSGQWLRVAWFLLQLVSQRREERSLVELVLTEARQSKYAERERVETMGMTVAEQWKAEGEAKGKAEGEAKGKAEGRAEAAREMLETVLTERFGPLPAAIQAALAGADAAAMKEWLRRALTAPTLEAVEISTEG
jgi:flagellar biosynthesis/type III secretory pathway protein FliH